MSVSDLESITWGDTPLGRIANSASMTDMEEFYRKNADHTQTLPKSGRRFPYHKHSDPVSYRRGISHSPSQTRRFSRHKLPRRMSAPPAILNSMHLEELHRGSIVIKTISTNVLDDVLEDPDPVVFRKDQETESEERSDSCSEKIFRIQNSIRDFIKRHQRILKRISKIIFLLLYFAYFAYAMYYRFGDEGSVRLLVCTIFGAVMLVLYQVSDYAWMAVDSMRVWQGRPRLLKIIRWLFYIAAGVAIVLSLITLVALKNPRHLLCLPGLAVFIVLTYVTSINPTKGKHTAIRALKILEGTIFSKYSIAGMAVCCSGYSGKDDLSKSFQGRYGGVFLLCQVQWHPVFWGLAIQYFCGLIILHMDWGVAVCDYLGDRVIEFLEITRSGAEYVFGKSLLEHRFAFAVLSVTLFFSTAVSVLYHVGVMQAIIRVLGRTLSFCFHTSPVEALNLAGNIFIGFIEAPLMIRPFLAVMTRSELHTVMTAGFATVAGTSLVLYAEYGVPAHHLLAACVMSAPAALAISKLSCPETEKTKSSLEDYLRLEGRPTENIIEAITTGATSSVKLVANVCVNIIAFICVFNFLNLTLIWFGNRVGIDVLSFEYICSYLLYPVALCMGVDPKDCRPVARMVGIKIFANELSAYSVLSEYYDNRELLGNYTVTNNTDWYFDGDDIVLPAWDNMTLLGGILSQRSEVITTYALCGYSNVGSVGIMLGILGALAPQKKLVLTQTVFRALVAGNIACFITACTAGLLYKET